MYYIIANLLSGKGAGKKCLVAAQNFLKENNLEFQTDFIDGHGSGRALAQKACFLAQNSGGADCNTVIAIGGDGTFHEVFDEFVTSKKAQGVADATLNNYKYHLIVLYILPYQEQKKKLKN